MARVAVFHNTLDFQGGADVVCLTACAALQRDHAVTLYTISETDPRDLAARFGIDLDTAALDVRIPAGGRPVARLLSAGAPAIGPQLALRSVLLRRAVDGELPSFDLVVSTANEVSLPTPSVQYVHYPQFHADRRPGDDGGRLNRVWSRLAAPRPEGLGDGTALLANSAWTAGVVDDVYGVRPSVLHPPVDPIEGAVDWAERRDGLVVVGRLAPDKRILDAIRIVDGVRERGHDLTLHIVGAAPRAYRRYVRQVESMAAERPYVTVERDASRERLEELLCTRKYGLNCKPEEHFGMSVAEYVAGGMVAFAPNSGGQREILDGRGDRLFGSTSEAIDLIAAAADADDPPTLPPDRFASDRFRRAIRNAVAREL
ncbi:glycosyltransferase [Halobellus ruber]|uniref:Glycosyltransferase n=1 Tax=Halobellus ruber TaxID=2761102 RepID=A0A7J9SL53_9EURY|nr:glycosyltransferase [Halobellus ruber]MBB6646737.1 glycosyltransferase [Halobellus ruber]